MFTFDHRLRLRCLQATTKSWERSRGRLKLQNLGTGGGAYGIGKETIGKVSAPTGCGFVLAPHRGASSAALRALAGAVPSIGLRACVGAILAAFAHGAIAPVLPDRISLRIAPFSTLLQAHVDIGSNETAFGHSHPGPA